MKLKHLLFPFLFLSSLIPSEFEKGGIEEKVIEIKSDGFLFSNPAFGAIFHRDCYKKYVKNSGVKIMNIGKGDKLYFWESYDFSDDEKEDALGYFKVMGYNFEKNLFDINPKASKVLFDNDLNGLPDKYYLDEDEDGFLEKEEKIEEEGKVEPSS